MSADTACTPGTCHHCYLRSTKQDESDIEAYAEVCRGAASWHERGFLPAEAAYFGWLGSESAYDTDIEGAADYLRRHHGR